MTQQTPIILGHAVYTFACQNNQYLPTTLQMLNTTTTGAMCVLLKDKLMMETITNVERKYIYPIFKPSDTGSSLYRLVSNIHYQILYTSGPTP